MKYFWRNFFSLLAAMAVIVIAGYYVIAKNVPESNWTEMLFSSSKTSVSNMGEADDSSANVTIIKLDEEALAEYFTSGRCSSKTELEELFTEVDEDLTLIEQYCDTEMENTYHMIMYINLTNNVADLYLTADLYFNYENKLEDITVRWPKGEYAIDTFGKNQTVPYKAYATDKLLIGSKCDIRMEGTTFATEGSITKYDLAKDIIKFNVKKDYLGDEHISVETSNRNLRNYCNSFFTDLFVITHPEDVPEDEVGYTLSLAKTNGMVSHVENLFDINSSISEAFSTRDLVELIHLDYNNVGTDNIKDEMLLRWVFTNPTTLETIELIMELKFNTMEYNNYSENVIEDIKVYKDGEVLLHMHIQDASTWEATSITYIVNDWSDIDMDGFRVVPSSSSYSIDADYEFEGTLNDGCYKLPEEDAPSDVFSYCFELVKTTE